VPAWLAWLKSRFHAPGSVPSISEGRGDVKLLIYLADNLSYTAPTADARPTWLPSMQHVAQEGRCFVVSGAKLDFHKLILANQYHTSADYPTDYPAQPPEGDGPLVWSRGGSCIIGPLGQVLAGPLWDKEGIIYAEVGSHLVRSDNQLDLDELDGARLDFDPVGHYSRQGLLLGLLT
jgi:nitrilase